MLRVTPPPQPCQPESRWAVSTQGPTASRTGVGDRCIPRRPLLSLSLSLRVCACSVMKKERKKKLKKEKKGLWPLRGGAGEALLREG